MLIALYRKNSRLATQVAEVLGYRLKVQKGAWETLPKGWTEESLKSFWGSLTGDVKHKITKCIKKMGEAGMKDPGAFCASLARRLDVI